MYQSHYVQAPSIQQADVLLAETGERVEVGDDGVIRRRYESEIMKKEERRSRSQREYKFLARYALFISKSKCFSLRSSVRAFHHHVHTVKDPLPAVRVHYLPRAFIHV